jgi:MFS family permease
MPVRAKQKNSLPANGSSNRTVLAVLLSANLLKYLDRQLLYPLLPLIKIDLELSDAQLGALATAFMGIYTCAAPIAGWLADQGRRPRWIGGSVAMWSAATALTGVVRGYVPLFAARGAVGIGQSAFSSIAPAFVSERWPKERRGSVLAWFSLAIPVGSALGYILGGWGGHHFGWRTTLLAAGLLGIAPALWSLRLKDFGRDITAQKRPRLSDYIDLLRVRSYLAATLAMTAMTFALGGLAVWMPTYFHRYFGLNVVQAGTLFGGLTVGAGLLGSLAGGWLSDRLVKVTPRAYFLISGVGLLLAMPAAAIALALPTVTAASVAFFIAEALAFLNMGPLNAVFTWVIAAPRRSMAFAANIFIIHSLGDVFSPWLIGLASDRWGLRSGLFGAILFLGIAGCICFWGARHLEEDSAVVKEA